MNKICTSLEQSKKLLELGIDVNTADMRYGYIAPYDYSDRMFDGGYDEVPYPKDFLMRNPNFSENEYDGELPAWSLASLLSIIPKHIGDSVFRMDMGETDINLWFDDLSSRTVDENLPDIIKENFVDACYEMVVRLKENNKI